MHAQTRWIQTHIHMELKTSHESVSNSCGEIFWSDMFSNCMRNGKQSPQTTKGFTLPVTNYTDSLGCLAFTNLSRFLFVLDICTN